MSTANEVLRWKERRTLVPVWISLGALFLFGLLMLMAGKTTGPANQQDISYLTLFWIGSSMIGLAAGILLFVPEREQGTDLFLGGLPVKSSAVSKAKLTEALLVFVIFVAVSLGLVVAAFWIRRGDFLLENVRWRRVAALAFIPVQTFLWSALCSLWFKTSLNAVISAAALSMIGWVAISVGSLIALEFLFGVQESNGQIFWGIVAGHISLVLLLCGAVWRLSSVWLRGRYESDTRSEVASKKQLAVASVSKQQSASYSMKSLLWQSARLNWGSMLLLCICIVAASFVATLIAMSQQYTDSFGYVFSTYRSLLAIAIFAGAFSGLLIFRGDQTDKSFLFFQTYADFPRKVWLSRLALLCVSLPVVICSFQWVVASLYTTKAGEAIQELPILTSQMFFNTNVANGVLVFLTAFSVGQLISILCRSGILAFIFTVAACFVLSEWLNTILKTSEPLFLFTVPLIATCLIASWWYAPRWISQRKPIRSIAIPIVLASSVFVACSVGYVWQRVTIPRNSIAAEFQEAFESHDQFLDSNKERFHSVFLMKEAVAALDHKVLTDEYAKLPLEKRGYAENWSNQAVDEHVRVNNEVLAKMEEALSYDLVYHWITPTSLSEQQSQYRTVAELLDFQSQHLKRKNDVSNYRDSLAAEVRAAWRLSPSAAVQAAEKVMKFCQWSEMEGQTDETLRSGIAKLKRLRSEIFDRKSKRIQYEAYFNIRRKYQENSNEQSFLSGFLSRGPMYWEQLRSERISLSEFARLDQAVRNDTQSPQSFWDQSGAPTSQAYLYQQLMPDVNPSEMQAIDHALSYATIRVALQVWRLEHDSYPETLDELALDGKNGAILNQVPKVSGGTLKVDFGYFPNGLNRAAYLPHMTTYTESGWPEVFDASTAIPSNTPFLLPFAGNFKLGPVLTGTSKNNDAKFLYGYTFVNPSQYGPNVNFFFLQDNPQRDYVLTVRESDSR